MVRRFALFLAVVVAGAQLQLSTGSAAVGSAASPTDRPTPRYAYTIFIMNPSDVIAMLDDTRINADSIYQLTNDIDMNGYTFTRTIGDDTRPFTSTFDGNFYRITNFSVNISGTGQVKAGLFGLLGTGHVVKNLTLSNSVTGASSDNAPQVGGLAGRAVGGEITNVKVTTSVTAIAGGVAARPTAGGIVGFAMDDTITRAQVNAGSIVIASGGVPTAGGIVGTNTNTLLDQVTSAASVTSRYPTDANLPAVAGGVNGLLYGAGTLIRDSYASGSVTVDRQSGALAHAILGGIVGDAASPSSGSIDRTYFYGASQAIDFATPYSGALAGALSAVNLGRSYHVSGVAGVGFLSAATQDDTGLDDVEQMQFASYAGTWPIVSTWQSPGANTWGICDGQSYPYLLWQVSVDPCISSNTISGTAQVGQQLTANADLAFQDDSLAYQWGTLDDTTFTLIAGADDSTYVVQEADRGHALAVSVTNLWAPFTVSARSTPTAVVPFPPPPPPTPVFPPGQPTSVTATPGDASATVAWTAPIDTGSFPVTMYEATATPGGVTCTTAALTCEVTGLANSTAYTFTVRALNGAGWGSWSSPSAAVTPTAPPTPTITITGTAEPRRVYVNGTATDLAAGTVLTVWVRMGARGEFAATQRPVVVAANGSFAWERKRGRGREVQVYFASDPVVSNTLTFRGR